MMKREGEKKDYAPPFEATTLALLPLEFNTIAKLLQDTSATTTTTTTTTTHLSSQTQRLEEKLQQSCGKIVCIDPKTQLKLFLNITPTRGL
jgi:hypothetical protein